jgi:phage terminase small subunit
MPTLKNSQHERFVLELFAGATQTDAYLAAGYKVKNAGAAAAAASRLLRQPEIKMRLEELKNTAEKAVLDDTSLTLSEHMAMLRMLRDEARAEGKLQAAIAAEVKRGELRRFYIKQIETGGPGEFSDLSDDELDQEVEAAIRAREEASKQARH